ncbi:MAG: HDOD domain-containing protein [Deltaproteobacteria bacterium]|nr:HDOD domain-containing protein [Deltaproteobacteria bacterium]MBW2130228.1 HDOD domain-containing protein [Deltaproteobacteria bacterium]MBW2304826.1 HDOD domain-containing protein [Deltaproteobacteria bacterium]
MDIPKRIDRFQVIKELGNGAQGVVYLALDPRLDRKVAIKTLHLRLSRDGERHASLLREAKTVGKLQHPNIIPVFEAGNFNGRPYLVFEYVEGVSLRELLKKEGPMEVHRAVSIMGRILDGMAYAHQHGVIHRDLSPSNILISAGDTPRIMDFGISVVMKDRKSQSGDLAGTPGYMPPESFSGGTLGPQSDVFSLGLIFYEMLVGQPAVKAENEFTAMYKTAHESLSPPSLQNEVVDEGLDAIILRSLEKDPDARYREAREMKRALEDYLKVETEDEGEVKSELDTNATVDFLLRRMRHKSDFPTFSRHIMEINRMASSGSLNYTSASQLANTIIKDYALTNKLLKLVNSAFYSHFSGRVTTVSRAVVILGFEQIRTAAASLLLFEHLQNKAQSQELKDAALSSFMSGMIAEELSGKMSRGISEEAFICAMLRNLGRHLVIFYFPEEYKQIKTRMIQKGISESAASRAILGISYGELGAGIARAWKFPEKIIQSMKPLPRGNLGPARSDEEVLRNLSAFSNSLCKIASTTEGREREKALSALIHRFEKSLPVSEKQISSLLDRARDRVKTYSDTLKINTSKSAFLRNLAEYSRGRSGAGKKEEVPRVAEEPEVSPDSSAPKYQALEIPETEVPLDETADPKIVLINGIQEITNTLLEDFEINSILTMILETMYRGFGFFRVLLCLVDPRRSYIQARFGFGDNIEKIMEDFGFKLKREADVFNLSLVQGKDLGIDDIEDPRIQSGIPAWYRKLVLAPAFVLYPIMINKKPLGLIYADRNRKGRVLSGDQLHYMKTLCNQAVLAMKQMRFRS